MGSIPGVGSQITFCTWQRFGLVWTSSSILLRLFYKEEKFRQNAVF